MEVYSALSLRIGVERRQCRDPVFFGIVVDMADLFDAFYVWGALMLVLGLCTVPSHLVSFKESKTIGETARRL